MKDFWAKVWENLKPSRRSRILVRQIEGILQRVDALPTLNAHSPQEILGYDEDGLLR